MWPCWASTPLRHEPCLEFKVPVRDQDHLRGTGHRPRSSERIFSKEKEKKMNTSQRPRSSASAWASLSPVTYIYREFFKRKKNEKGCIHIPICVFTLLYIPIYVYSWQEYSFFLIPQPQQHVRFHSLSSPAPPSPRPPFALLRLQRSTNGCVSI